MKRFCRGLASSWTVARLHPPQLDPGRGPAICHARPPCRSVSSEPALCCRNLHFLFNICTPLILLKMIERTPRSLPPLAVHLGVIAVAMGTSLHLVTDAITRRLVLIGYQLHLSVRENPIMEELRPPAGVFPSSSPSSSSSVVVSITGHRRTRCRRQPGCCFYRALLTTGQTFILFIFTFFAMTANLCSAPVLGFLSVERRRSEEETPRTHLHPPASR
ncbi:hypothetical protein F7725_023464, partial [Dissostichus mawsoni]